MKATKNIKKAKPTVTDRINIKISKKAYRRLSTIAKREGRTILSALDAILAV